MWVSTILTPTKQSEMAAKIANFTSGQILHSFHYRKKEHIISLYRSFVRPKLEFSMESLDGGCHEDAGKSARAGGAVDHKETWSHRRGAIGECQPHNA